MVQKRENLLPTHFETDFVLSAISLLESADEKRRTHLLILYKKNYIRSYI